LTYGQGLASQNFMIERALSYAKINYSVWIDLCEFSSKVKPYTSVKLVSTLAGNLFGAFLLRMKYLYLNQV